MPVGPNDIYRSNTHERACRAWEQYYLARHVAFFRAGEIARRKARSGRMPPSE